MIERKLKINLEGLWENPHNLFTVRYKDTSKTLQTILATRIKQEAYQAKIRALTGPSVEVIEQVLNEINPIIFSEYHSQPNNNTDWIRGHKRFSTSAARFMAGYTFTRLCQAIYLITCNKKPLTIDQLVHIAGLTCIDYIKVSDYITTRTQAQETEERITPIEDIGIEDIARAGRNINTPERINNFTIDEAYDIADEVINEERNGAISLASSRLTAERVRRALNAIPQDLRPNRFIRYWGPDVNQNNDTETEEENQETEPSETELVRSITDIEREFRRHNNPNQNRPDYMIIDELN